ncbi:MAG: HU family DNA-binding protein [Tannerellaceae bacterium]|jgi:predicted histone-like DNA-binding protein|nr:HU family DNA-binding protein [Tannerellaceae bacterium]
MAAYYDFYQNPPSAKRKESLHARVITSGTVDTNYLAQEIQEQSTLSTADVKGVLTALGEVAARHFKNGERIHIEGFGFFQITLSCPAVKTPKEIRAESVRFKSVVFRPESALLKLLGNIRFERVSEKRHSTNHSGEEIDNRLTHYFSLHPTLTREDYQRLGGYTKTTANRRLKQLLAEGKLQKAGFHHFPVYEPAKGFYGRE